MKLGDLVEKIFIVTGIKWLHNKYGLIYLSLKVVVVIVEKNI